MKIGTTPKMTVGSIGLIALIIIGFIGLRYINAPIVEERVYLLPWEERTVRPRNNLETFPTDTAQWAGNWNNLPQIATTSIAGTEPVDDFFGQPSEMDTAQFTTETKFEPDTMQGFTTNISASSESTDQSAEDVMYAYMEAWRNVDYKAMGSLMTEQYRREGHEDSDDGDSINMSDESPDEVVETMRQFERMVIENKVRERRRESWLVSSEYVGDEFHFLLRTPGSKLPGTTDQGMPIFCCASIHQIKMRQENGVWRVYDAMTSIENVMSEGRAANMSSDMGRSGYDDSGTPIEIRGEQYKSSDRIPAESVEATAEGKREQLEPLPSESIREMQSRTSAINDEYVGDEVHFRLRMPAPKTPDGRKRGIEMSVPSLPDTVTKVRKEEGVSRVDESGLLD
jgi:hypothetical protein